MVLSKMLAKKGTQKIQAVVPNEKEWMIVFTFVNATREYLPNFYIFKGTRKIKEYVSRCQDGAIGPCKRKARWMLIFSANGCINFLKSWKERRFLALQEGIM